MQYMSPPTRRSCGPYNYDNGAQHDSLVAIAPPRSLTRIAAGLLLLGHEARTG